MSRTLISRLGAGVIAAALVAGGSLLAAAPATAAEPNTITVANTSFQSGAGWGAGLQITGAGFPASTPVTIHVGAVTADTGDDWGQTAVTTDASGAFITTFVPEIGPFDLAADEQAIVLAEYVDAESDATVFSNLVQLQIAAFVPNAQTVTVDPICLSGDAARDPGVMIGATGFGQFEAGITFSVVDAAGTAVQGAEGQTLTADATGSLPPKALTLYSTAGNISDGQYTITFVGSVTTAGVFQVGPCEVPATPAAVAPAAVVPASPQLANTGSSDAGALVGGSALLLLVGAALLVARRRQDATA